MGRFLAGVCIGVCLPFAFTVAKQVGEEVGELWRNIDYYSDPDNIDMLGPLGKVLLRIMVFAKRW